MTVPQGLKLTLAWRDVEFYEHRLKALLKDSSTRVSPVQAGIICTGNLVRQRRWTATSAPAISRKVN